MVSDHEPARVDQKLAPELGQEKAELGAGDSSPPADGSPSVDDKELFRLNRQSGPESVQDYTGLGADDSPPSADKEEFFGGVTQDGANDGAVSLGEIRALKAPDDKRGRNG